MNELEQARKSRNQMHRRAQLAEAKLKATYKILELEGEFHLDAPVSVNRSGDIVRLLLTISTESYWRGIEAGKKMHAHPLRATAAYIANHISGLARWIRGFAS